eukprot:3381562-Prymnesium_polylepis.1
MPSAEAGQFLRRSGYTIANANKGARATYDQHIQHGQHGHAYRVPAATHAAHAAMHKACAQPPANARAVRRGAW